MKKSIWQAGAAMNCLREVYPFNAYCYNFHTSKFNLEKGRDYANLQFKISKTGKEQGDEI